MELIRAFRQRVGWGQIDLATALEVAPATVGRWESAQEPSTYYWERLAELAEKHGFQDLRRSFLQAMLEKQGVSPHAWETAVSLLREAHQLLIVSSSLKHDELNRAETNIVTAIDNLDPEGDATSAPDGQQIETAVGALDRIRRIRSGAWLRVAHTGEPGTSSCADQRVRAERGRRQGGSQSQRESAK